VTDHFNRSSRRETAKVVVVSKDDQIVQKQLGIMNVIDAESRGTTEVQNGAASVYFREMSQHFFPREVASPEAFVEHESISMLTEVINGIVTSRKDKSISA